MKKKELTIQSELATKVENELIAALVIDPEAGLKECQKARLAPEHFYNPSFQDVYVAIRSLGPKATDPVCIRAELVRMGKPDKVYKDLAKSIADSITTSIHVGEYAKMIRENHHRRELASLGASIQVMAEAERPLSEIAQTAREALGGVEKGMGWARVQPFSEGIDDLLDAIANDQGDGLLSCETGFEELDTLLQGGLKQGELVIAAGRPSMGKTVLGVQIAGHSAVRQGKRVLLFSLEMPAKQLQLRLLSAMSGVPEKCLKHNVGVDWKKVTEAQVRLKGATFGIFDQGRLSIPDLRSMTAAFAAQHDGVDLVVIDYLGLMETGKTYDNRNLEVSFLTKELKALAREYNCAVLSMAQLNRGVEARPDKRPMMSDLRDSGSIEQDADVIALLYRADYYDPQTTDAGLAEIHVAKNRNGETGTVYLEHDFHRQRFRTTSRRPA